MTRNSAKVRKATTMVMTTISTPSRLRRFLSAWAGVSESGLLILLVSSMVKRGAVV
jgi:hypothetical protein